MYSLRTQGLAVSGLGLGCCNSKQPESNHICRGSEYSKTSAFSTTTDILYTERFWCSKQNAWGAFNREDRA